MIQAINNPASNHLYLRTTPDKNGNYAQIMVNKDDLTDVVENEWGLKNTLPITNQFGGQPVNSALMTDYLKALNGILPNGIKLGLPKMPCGLHDTHYRILGNDDGSRMTIRRVHDGEVEDILTVSNKPE